MAMQQKWIVFILTFFSYSVIHAIRTAWGAIKPQMENQPYKYSQTFAGDMDMTVLLCLAVSLHLFGWLSGKWNVKLFLLGGMALLALIQIIFGLVLLSSSKTTIQYYFLFGLIGVFSCTGWPSVFFIISKYFTKENTIALCIFNAASQCGDIIALISSQIIIKILKLPDNVETSSVIFSIAVFVIIMIIADWIFLHPKKQKELNNSQRANHERGLQNVNQNQLNGENNIKIEIELPKNNIPQSDFPNPNDNQIVISNPSDQNISKRNDQKVLSIANNGQIGQIEDPNLNLANSQINTQRVNGLNVWCLPSVFLIVLSFSLIKTMNTLAADWFVEYFADIKIGLSQQGRILQIIWALSVFVGGICSAIYNKSLKNSIFVIQLIGSGVIFYILQQLDNTPNAFLVALLIILSGFLFGGPYYLIATAVPLMLGQKQEIKNRPGAIAAIISVMQGSGQLVGALMMALIPKIGSNYLFYMAALLTGLAGLIIAIIIVKDKYFQLNNELQIQKKPSQI